MKIEPSQPSPLPEEQYYHHQIIGLQVRTTSGDILGSTIEILTGKSNDTYIVQGTSGEILIPAIDDVIKSIDIEQGYIVIEPIDGLLNLNQKKAH